MVTFTKFMILKFTKFTIHEDRVGDVIERKRNCGGNR